MARMISLLLLIGAILIGFRSDSNRPSERPILPPKGPIQAVDGLVVPEGFIAEEVYPSDQLGSVVSLNFDTQGRLVIGQQQGTPVKALLDTDGDGFFDEERIISEEVTNAQGILFDGLDALVVGNGPQGAGLYRLVDNDGDSRAERVELIERAWGNMGQHGAHGIFWGPDGYLYWDQGNAAGILDDYLPLSPLRDYQEATLNGRCDPRGHACNWRAPGGVFMRTNIASREVAGEAVSTPENTSWELFAGGFRNQYDGAFNLLGELFTYDSDMEWDLNLPFYKGTSSVHVIAGGDHAWRSGSMNHPWYYFDNLPPMADVGRGSPTGVTVLQTYNYPAEYYDMVLQADWSRGRVIGGATTKNGATYSQEDINFVYGEPLNATDLEVGPDGNLYISLGGGGGPGAVYRISYQGSDAMGAPEASTALDRVLTMIYPRSAFSRKLAQETKAELGESAWQAGLWSAASDASSPAERRVRALELLQVHGPGLEVSQLEELTEDASWEVRAAVAYYLGMQGMSAQGALVAMAHDADPFVQRRALEGLMRTGIHPAVEPSYSAVEDILPLLENGDRFVRYQARQVLKQTRRGLWEHEALATTGYPQAPEALMAFAETMHRYRPRITDVTRLASRAAALLQDNPSEAELMPLVRVIQRTLIEDYNVLGHDMENALAYTGDLPLGQNNNQEDEEAYEVMSELLMARFPAQDAMLSREISRVLAYLQPPGSVEKLSMELHNDANSREQQIHYAEQLSYMDEGWDEASVDRVASWLEKVYAEQWRGGASFGGYINYVREALLEVAPPASHDALMARLQSALEASQPELARQILEGGRLSSPLADQELFEDLVYRPNVLQGDPAAGVWAYQKAACASCHSFGPVGTAFGPDLTTVHQRFSRRDLVRSVIFPHEEVSDIYPTEEITRTNGEVVAGLVRDAGNNLVVSIAAGADITIPKAEVQSRVRTDRSSMPEGLLNALSNNERRDLMALLLEGPTAIPDSTLARVNGN